MSSFQPSPDSPSSLLTWLKKSPLRITNRPSPNTTPEEERRKHRKEKKQERLQREEIATRAATKSRSATARQTSKYTSVREREIEVDALRWEVILSSRSRCSSDLRGVREVGRMCRRGVPTRVRGRVWLEGLIGNELKIGGSIYEECAERGREGLRRLDGEEEEEGEDSEGNYDKVRTNPCLLTRLREGQGTWERESSSTCVFCVCCTYISIPTNFFATFQSPPEDLSNSLQKP